MPSPIQPNEDLYAIVQHEDFAGVLCRYFKYVKGRRKWRKGGFEWVDRNCDGIDECESVLKQGQTMPDRFYAVPLYTNPPTFEDRTP